MCCEQVASGSLGNILENLLPLIGVFIGGIISYWATQSLAKSERIEERKSLANALAGELEGYMTLTRRRDYVGHYRTLIKIARDAPTPLILSQMVSRDETQNDNFPILNANLSKIGLLGSVCRPLAEFHANLNGVFATLKAAHAGYYDLLPKDEVLKIVEEELSFWNMNFQRCDLLLAHLKEVAAGARD